MPMGNNTAVATLGELLQASEFVTLHVPLSETTTNMISAPQLKQMKQGRCGCTSLLCLALSPWSVSSGTSVRVSLGNPSVGTFARPSCTECTMQALGYALVITRLWAAFSR